MSDEGERVAAELRRIRDAVRDLARDPAAALPPARQTRRPEAPAEEPRGRPIAPPPPPDAGAVNALWRAEPARFARGLLGLFHRLLRQLLGPSLEAQVAFNSRQVQLDNEVLAYIDARFAETHRHYDQVLGVTGRHLGEVDERHRILQEELVAHVHDLVKRIDLVLEQAERSRLSLESALRDVRGRLARLEERLPRG